MFNGPEWHMIGNRLHSFPPAMTSEPGREIKAGTEGLCGGRQLVLTHGAHGRLWLQPCFPGSS